MRPAVLDFDRSVKRLPGELRVDLGHLEGEIRYGCAVATLDRLQQTLERALPRDCVAFLGSGDFHHVSVPLIRRLSARGPLHVVVLDNHPDNMRFVLGVHCGSWVRQVARLPFVTQVDVVGITSTDVAGAHLVGNYLAPLLRGRVRYWCVGVDTSWSGRLGVRQAIRSFESAKEMLDSFMSQAAGRDCPVYLSVDKDVLRREVVRTNWDQGVLTDDDVMMVASRLSGHIVGADVTGDVSAVRHPYGWKRVLSALDAQPTVDPAALPCWQAQHGALNARLLSVIGGG